MILKLDPKSIVANCDYDDLLLLAEACHSRLREMREFVVANPPLGAECVIDYCRRMRNIHPSIYESTSWTFFRSAIILDRMSKEDKL